MPRSSGSWARWGAAADRSCREPFTARATQRLAAIASWQRSVAAYASLYAAAVQTPGSTARKPVSLCHGLQRHLPPKSSQYSTPRPTRLDEIKNLHSTDTIDTENSGTRGRPIWVHSSQGGKADSKWVCRVVPAYPNVSPGPMNGSILLRRTGVYCTANFSVGGGVVASGSQGSSQVPCCLTRSHEPGTCMSMTCARIHSGTDESSSPHLNPQRSAPQRERFHISLGRYCGIRCLESEFGMYSS